MKRTVRLLALLMMAVIYGSSAMAVVDPYEVMQVTPAEGEVESLQHFTITFADLPVIVGEDVVPLLEKGGGATYEGRMQTDEAGTTVLIDFDESCTASGHYFLHLPEGSLTVNGQRLLPMSLRFNITGTMESFYDQITIDPAEGELESLQNFTISFPEYVGEIAYGSRPTLTNTTTGAVYQGQMYDVGFKVLANFPMEVTDSGEYTLSIPAGAIVFYSLGSEVHELEFHYSLTGTAPSFYDKITIDPAEGRVESLQNFTITFPMDIDALAPDAMAMLTNTTTGATYEAAMSSLEDKVFVTVAEEITEPARYTLTIPAGAVFIDALGEEMPELNFDFTITGGELPEYTINPPEGEVHILQYFTIAYSENVTVDEEAHPILANDETGEEFECNMMEIGGNAVIYKEYPLSVVGTYTLTVPANCISSEISGQSNPEMVFHYTLTEKETFVPPVIETQPEGELKLYMRMGGVVSEVEKEYTVPEGESPYEIIYGQQEGALSIVYAPDNKVYIQHPVSLSYYDGWVEGTLSDDGRTITVPMGQYIAYTKSLEMAVQVAMFRYDEEADTYFYDESVEEVTYTIEDDGTVRLNGTDQTLILGTMNRAFGDVFQYLDYEWLQDGDYASVYILAEQQPLTPPEGLVTSDFYMTTAVNDGMDWDPLAVVVKMGMDGEDVWLQGISRYLPEAWIKGVHQGDKIIFENPQLLGSYGMLFYFKCAAFDPITGYTTQKNMELTINGDGSFSTIDYIFTTVHKDELQYINYYQGLTLSQYPDIVVIPPIGLQEHDYNFSYKTKAGPYGPLVPRQMKVKVVFFEDEVYIRGMCELLPNAWVMGRLVDGKLVMNLSQFLGNYKEEYSATYPLFLTAFDNSTGLLVPQVEFNCDETNRTFTGCSYPLSIGINKTGYLSLQDYFDGALIPDNSGVETIVADDAYIVGYYDLQGRQLEQAPYSGIYLEKYSDGTTLKVLK